MRKRYQSHGDPRHYYFNRRTKVSQRRLDSAHILETFTLPQLQANHQYSEDLCKYWWELYSELALQRSGITDSLSETISRNSLDAFPFEHWQRTLKYVYSLSPLSTTGSIKFGGGRFNIGDIDESRFPVFQALYLAEDKETALAESLGQAAIGPLDAMQIALTNPQSVSILSFSGEIENVFDLTNTASLDELAAMFSRFTVSDRLWREARRLKMIEPKVSGSSAGLLETFLDPNWRVFPQMLDVPANPQVFGQLVNTAQGGGIVFLSKFTGKKCLAIFPKNFENTNSFVQLDDLSPSNAVTTRIDQSNWRLTEKIT